MAFGKFALDRWSFISAFENEVMPSHLPRGEVETI